MTGPIVTTFSAESTATEVVADLDLSGIRAVVTGGASGIGVETVRALAGAGASVTIGARNVARALQVVDEISSSTTNKVDVAALDLSNLTSVRAFADAWTGPLDVLINNAGVMMTPETRTDEGWDLQFATNHVGHAALAIALHGALAAADGARIVSVSSSAHLLSDIAWSDIHFEHRPYNPLLAYAQSKTANILFAVGATRQWSDDGIAANAVHPGVIPDTNLLRHVFAERTGARPSDPTSNVGVKTCEQGAATSVFVATSGMLMGVGGRYFEDCQEALPNEPGERSGYAAWAVDPESADRLWRVTSQHLRG